MIPDVDTYWLYKGKLYRVTHVHMDKFSQNNLGDWGPTVEYEAEGVLDKSFFRERTEFLHKFERR